MSPLPILEANAAVQSLESLIVKVLPFPFSLPLFSASPWLTGGCQDSRGSFFTEPLSYEVFDQITALLPKNTSLKRLVFDVCIVYCLFAFASGIFLIFSSIRDWKMSARALPMPFRLSFTPWVIRYCVFPSFLSSQLLNCAKRSLVRPSLAWKTSKHLSAAFAPYQHCVNYSSEYASPFFPPFPFPSPH